MSAVIATPNPLETDHLKSLVRVAIVEDEAPVRKSLETAVKSGQGMSWVFSAQSVKEAVENAKKNPAQVYLVDLGLPDADGREFIRWLKIHQPDALSMVVTVFGDDSHIVSSFSAGAMGYLLKDSSSEEIVQQIAQLVSGGSPISPSVARKMLSHFITPNSATSAASAALPSPLSEREHEVLTLIEKGLSYEEIAQILNISWHTVTGYLRRVYKKLEVNSRGEAVFEARARGFL